MRPAKPYHFQVLIDPEGSQPLGHVGSKPGRADNSSGITSVLVIIQVRLPNDVFGCAVISRHLIGIC